MADPKPGDVVACRIKEDMIVSSYSDYDTTEYFQVIALDYWGIYIYVPDYLNIAAVSKIDDYTANSLNIKQHFVGSYMLYIKETNIVSIRSLDGCICSRCNEFFHQAQANDDGIFTCFLCRTYKYR